MTERPSRSIYDAALPEDLRQALRQEVQEQIIGCLNRFYSLETAMWGKPVDALIVRTVVQGQLQNRLYDLSALSAALDLPIATLHRKVGDLEAAGYLRRERRGKSVCLVPTEETCRALDQSFEEMIGALRRLYRANTL
ncbi:ArsR family transcriptional regulator [Pseudodonghicola flavimaris]|uniref:ArsR family transcriptional regulator n=1 Tax=Pseudodonghicola flavimaris TaxID=3050036 RepID=A0ABT7EX32_9RHOB|nr:ArsR family transcriptional regulator [Pseudodonghicola flavimaris]MDK3016899.1 ArsR family transcriptional regulator [Pseudodonghicola flavimaris]